jgi:integrase
MKAFASGLRKEELRSLVVRDLDIKRGGLVLRAEWTKNRKDGFQPLPAFLV